MTAKRYPFAPLEHEADVDSRTAELAGVTRRSVVRWRTSGLSREQAERVAGLFCRHPYELWPEMAADDLNDELEARRAYQREWWKTRWASMTEEQREAKRQYTREYRAHARAAVNASRRRFYQNNREKELARQREYDARRRAERRAA